MRQNFPSHQPGGVAVNKIRANSMVYAFLDSATAAAASALLTL